MGISIDQGKALARRFVEEVLNTGDFSTADHFLAPDYVEHSAPPGMPANRQGVETIFGMLHSAFPDFRYVIEELIAEGARVVLRLTAKGTMHGALFGHPPTGEYAEWPEIHIVRIRDGKVVEHWDVKDTAIRARQLGLAPSAAHGQ
jgi:predicted ester cyclase